jgi:hypothetical protein
MAQTSNIVNRNAVLSLIRQHFSKDGIPVKTGKRGRPYTKSIQDVANDYLAPLPQGLVEGISENVDLIGSFLNELVRNRRPLTEAESEYILNGIDIVEGEDEEGNEIVKHYGGRDAQAMGVLNGEPTQNDIYVRFSVEANEKESIGTVFKRRAERALSFAQDEANEAGRTLYVIVERYAVERNLRDEKTALTHKAPLSAVGLMSKNVVAIIVTDNREKSYKGQVALVGTCTPQPKETPQAVTEEEFLELQALVNA